MNSRNDERASGSERASRASLDEARDALSNVEGAERPEVPASAREGESEGRSPSYENEVIERTSSADDLEAVAALEEATFTNPWTLEMLTRELARPEVGRLYVLRLPRIPVAAFCACWTVADELHINTIAVTAELRRQGLGTRLMEHVLRDASRDGFRRATLEVRRSNEAAQRLYSRLGFSVAAIRPGYYTQPEEDALILWREAGSPLTDQADPEP